MFPIKFVEIREVMEAAEAGDLDKIKLMASLGVMVDALSSGEGGLRTAAISGHVDIVKYFLDNYQYPENYKARTLVAATFHGKTAVVKLLLEYGVFDPETIHRTIENDHLDIMKYVLDYNSDYLYAENVAGYVPLQNAVLNGKLLAVKELLGSYKADPQRTGRSFDTAWKLAISEDKGIPMLQLLLQSGVDINQVLDAKSQRRAIHYALDRQNTLEIAEFLASTGADLQVCDALGNTLLHFILGHEIFIDTADSVMSKIQFLVEHGVDYEAQNSHGQHAKSLLAKENKITTKQFDISVVTALKAIQENKRIIALTLELTSNAVQLPQLPSTLALLMADYVGGYGKALSTTHLSSLSFVTNNTKSISTTQVNSVSDENKEDCEKQDDASDSSSNTPAAPPGGNGIKASSSSAKPSDEQQPLELDQFLPTAEPYTSYRKVTDLDESGSALLMKLFSWIKDLPKILQQEIIASYSMQSVLELLDSLAQPYKFIDGQLSGLSLEEIFVSDYNKHYRQDSLYQAYSQDEAHANRHDAVVSLDKTVGTISSYGILIDQLPNYDHSFATPCLLVGMASL